MEGVVTVLGVAASGRPAAPLDPFLPPERTAAILELLDADHLAGQDAADRSATLAEQQDQRIGSVLDLVHA